MVKHFFVFEGLDSRELGLILSGETTVNAPERDVSIVDIPGRNGSLTIDNGRFKNITVSYPASIVEDFERRFGALRAKLLSFTGSGRLEDSIHPDEFRLAAFLGPLEPITTPYNKAGSFTVSFDCQPQRFLKSGEAAFTLAASGGTLYNPTLFDALPLIKVIGSGAGTLTVAGVTVSFSEIDGWVMLDSDTQNAYKGVTNKNATVSAPEFPVLRGGANLITWTGGVTGVEITPRWWTV